MLVLKILKFRSPHFQKQDNYGDTQTYHLMTSVSLPVYDKRPLQVSRSSDVSSVPLYPIVTCYVSRT